MGQLSESLKSIQFQLFYSKLWSTLLCLLTISRGRACGMRHSNSPWQWCKYKHVPPVKISLIRSKLSSKWWSEQTLAQMCFNPAERKIGGHILGSNASSRCFRVTPSLPHHHLFLSLNVQVLQEETAIPGSDLNLMYLSSRAAGYRPVLKVIMTQATIPFNLMKVHLMVAAVGRLFQKWFPAEPNLSYTFIWDKTDAYNQRVYGLSEAVGK